MLVGGGARSGKSRFALERALALGAASGLFIATAEASDDEMRARIARHREERGARLRTVEAPRRARRGDRGRARRPARRRRPRRLPHAVALEPARAGATADEVLRRVEELARRDRAPARVPIVLVTNEVGMGLVPETPLGRVFRDVAGLAHQRLARDADEIHVAVLGLMLRLRPGPVAVHEPAPREEGVAQSELERPEFVSTHRAAREPRVILAGP